jgi:hypothetical protein
MLSTLHMTFTKTTIQMSVAPHTLFCLILISPAPLHLFDANRRIQSYPSNIRGSVERNVDALVQLLQIGGCHILLVFSSLPDRKESHLNSSTLSLLSFFRCPLFFPSDESAEVAVVKTAIIQHIELDSKIMLSVLCDQVVPVDDPMQDEDKVIRERLPTLVVAFFTEDARRPLLIKSQGTLLKMIEIHCF